MLALAKAAPGAGRLALLERDVPAPDDHDVVIEVRACGICGSDLHLQRSELAFVEAAFPLWLGHEYAGRVLALGRGVTTVRVGDAVTAEPSVGCGRCPECQAGHPNVCRQRRFEAGGFAPRVMVPESRVHRVPDGVSFLAGALMEPLACAVHGVLEVGCVRAGDTVVVVGPGPIGLVTALVAQAQGADVVLVGRASSRPRLDLARSLGIRHVVSTPDDAHVRVLDLSGGQGADTTFGCAGGGGALRLGSSLLRRRGRYVEMGLGEARDEVDITDVVTRELTLSGAVSHRPASWRRALDLVRRTRVPASTLEGIVTASYPIERWPEAFAAAASRRHGKVVIVPTNEPASGDRV